MRGGEAYYCVTLTLQNRDGKYRPMWYPYHADQFGPWGSNWPVDAEVPINRWFCMEIMVKLNTPGQRNGEIRVWQDGAEVFRHTQLPIRKADSVKIRSVHDQCRIDSRRFTGSTRFWVDNLVVASAYMRRNSQHPRNMPGSVVK